MTPEMAKKGTLEGGRGREYMYTLTTHLGEDDEMENH